MTYTITNLCTREGDCVEVCPVDCIVPSGKGTPLFETFPLLYIDPDVCIDCGACVPACPPEAIFPDFEVPEEHEFMTEINAQFFEVLGAPTWDFDLEEEKGMPEGWPRPEPGTPSFDEDRKAFLAKLPESHRGEE
jgi:ferredoxin